MLLADTQAQALMLEFLSLWKSDISKLLHAEIAEGIAMLYEQAFVSLPEFLTGLPYQKFDYEGTLMSAFAMAVLQELNGRNINNPISCLRAETKYHQAHDMRADLHLDLDAMNIITPTLNKYGIFNQNWLEAKFFKLNEQGRPTVDKLKVTLLLLKDIIRLVALPPETIGRQSQGGRYLLHAYQGPPEAHVAERKNKGAQANASGFTRKWVRRIRTPGRGVTKHIRASKEVSQFDTIIGSGLRPMQLEFDTTTFAYEPWDGDLAAYWCYLTRIDDFYIALGNHWFKRKKSSLEESKPHGYKNVVDGILEGLAG